MRAGNEERENKLKDEVGNEKSSIHSSETSELIKTIIKDDISKSNFKKKKISKNISKLGDLVYVHKDVYKFLCGKMSYEEYMGYKPHQEGDSESDTSSSSDDCDESGDSVKIDTSGESEEGEESAGSNTVKAFSTVQSDSDSSSEDSFNFNEDSKKVSSSKKKHKKEKKNAEKLTYECELCGFRTGPSRWNKWNKAKIISHYRRHTNKNILRCENCNYIGCHGQAYVDHVMSHYPEEKPLRCKICNFRTGRMCDLRIHYTKHHTLRGWDCDKCLYKAKTVKGLRKHYYTHYDGRNFTCPACPFRSYLRSGIIFHLSQHILTSRKRTCCLCTYVVEDFEKLKYHICTRHTKQIVNLYRIPYRGRELMRILVKGQNGMMLY